MRVYIAGPIAGYPNLNREAFTSAAEKLLSLGHIPVNPHDVAPTVHDDGECIGDPTAGDHGYGCFMVPDLRALLGCRGYTLLKGWERSRGATVEEAVAKICGFTYVNL